MGGYAAIGESAFGGSDSCDNLTIVVTAGSIAEQYAAEEDVPYILK